jgi:hypothetical protein
LEPVIRFVDGDPVTNLQIAHIRAAEAGGPRYADVPREQRRAFSNLILLCHPHHTIVDKRRPQDFPARTLEKWKAEREQNHEVALNQLGNVTAEGLQEVFAQVLKDRDEKIQQALGRLEQSDAEAAQLLRGLVDEVADLRQSRYLDSGVTENFARAADQLYQVFQSGAMEEFARAARRLPPY